MKNILVTGGLGFIGLNLVEMLVNQKDKLGIDRIDILDKNSYASDLSKFNELFSDYSWVHLSIIDLSDSDFENIFNARFENIKFDTIFHLAAESHVDNSIKSPRPFVMSNILGTFNLIEYFRTHYDNNEYRFHHVSTDEVYGDLPLDDPFIQFNLGDPYKPSSPYSASKAASDHLVRSYIKTYGFPATISNCGNNYGRYQHKEKLIPHAIECLARGAKFPLYGNGTNVRDWIHVTDHCKALIKCITDGKIGETYLIGACNELPNSAILTFLCEAYYKVTGETVNYDDFIEFVEDRKAHDSKYAINNESISSLGWKPEIEFTDGIMDTIKYYLEKL